MATKEQVQSAPALDDVVVGTAECQQQTATAGFQNVRLLSAEQQTQTRWEFQTVVVFTAELQRQS